MGIEMDHTPAVSSTVADPLATSMDAPQALFDAPCEIFVYLGLAMRHEQDPTLFKFISHSWDLLPRGPLCTVLPTSALR